MFYWAPEVLRNNNYRSQNTDVYAFGILVGEIVDRAEPYDKERAKYDITGNMIESKCIPYSIYPIICELDNKPCILSRNI